MDFYEKLINVRGKDIESEIRDSLKAACDYYGDLTTERTCFIYSSKIFEELKSRGVSARFIDTENDLDCSYLHYFVLVPYNKDMFYLVDPTFKQFSMDEDCKDLFKDLLTCGYTVIDDEKWSSFLKIINSSGKTFVKDDLSFRKKWVRKKISSNLWTYFFDVFLFSFFNVLSAYLSTAKLNIFLVNGMLLSFKKLIISCFSSLVNFWPEFSM